MGENDREYPFWLMVRAEVPNARIEHILVSGETQDLQTAFAPCAIVFTERAQPFRMTYQDETYRRAWRNRLLTLYLRQGFPP